MATAGDVILGVRLVEMLGRGPNGTVWTARDADGKTLAVKLFEPLPRASESGSVTFRRGVATLNQAVLLDAKGACSIARLHAVSVDELALSYDYFDNGNAGGIPALGWDVSRTLEFFGRICRSVAGLHEIGLTHRALKPSNVLVDDRLLPVLVDPGMVGPRDPNQGLSGADVIYRAPEEVGSDGVESPTADVFSLGMLLWFLLLGSDPDEPYQAFATLGSLAGRPPGLVRIVRKATAHDPAARYQWVEELEADLARYTQHELVGLGVVGESDDYPRYAISSLPARPARQRPDRQELGTPRSDDRPERVAAWSTGRVAGWLGAAAVAAASVYLFAAPAPSPSAAEIFGIVSTLGLALCTLLLKPLPARPALGRIAVFGAVLAVLIPLELDRLAILRWQFTLEHGNDEARAKVARFLARHGARDLRGARLAGGDLVRADLGRADLRTAQLARANLSGTNLSESNLAGADVRGANLEGADLLSSNISEATGWLEARCNRFTAMPRSWACVGGHPASRRD
jgi:serine/threonine-protein kinase